MNIAPPQLSIFRHPWLQWCLWYCINVFVQMTKIFFNWLMRLVDWFHWHFCIVVRLRVLTSFESNFKKSAFCLAFMFVSNYLICWFAVKNYAKKPFRRLKMFVIHVWYMIFKYMRKSRNFHAGLSGACSDKFSSCSQMHHRDWTTFRGTVEHTVYITKSVILHYRRSDSKRVLAFVALAHRGLGAASTLPCHSNQRCRSNTK